jgi:site-specific recombinase XerC
MESKQKKRDGVKSASLNRITKALKAAINWAVKREIIEQNPLTKLELLPETDSVKKILQRT